MKSNSTASNFKEKVFLVTGGASGIGEEIVTQALQKGANVAFCGRQANKLDKLKIKLAKQGFDDQAVSIKADISNSQDVQMLFDATLQRFGHIDFVINNAAITRDYLLLSMPYEDWLELMNINLTGVFMVSQYALKRFSERAQGGKILTIGSIAQNGSPSAVAYATSKAAVVGLMQAIAKEFGPKGISANVISFGLVDTDMTNTYPEFALETIKNLCPLRRSASAEEAAAIVLQFATLPPTLFNGQSLSVSGGLNDLPAIFFSSKTISH